MGETGIIYTELNPHVEERLFVDMRCSAAVLDNTERQSSHPNWKLTRYELSHTSKLQTTSTQATTLKI